MTWLNTFHALNWRRMHEAFPPSHSITALVVCVQEEVGELAAAVLGVTGEKARKAHLTNADVLDAVADAMTYLSLVASSVGCTDLEALLATTFNMVSDRAKTDIKVPMPHETAKAPEAPNDYDAWRSRRNAGKTGLISEPPAREAFEAGQRAALAEKAPEVAEPSDDALFEIELRAGVAAVATEDKFPGQARRRALFNAGRASEAAAHAAFVEQLTARVDRGNKLTQAAEAELERVRAELAELQRNHDELLAEGDSRFDDYEKQTGDALDRAGFANNLPGCRDGSIARIVRAGVELAALREGRPEPGDLFLAETLFRAMSSGRGDAWNRLLPQSRDWYEQLARAAKSALLGVRRPTKGELVEAIARVRPGYGHGRVTAEEVADVALALFTAPDGGQKDSGVSETPAEHERPHEGKPPDGQPREGSRGSTNEAPETTPAKGDNEPPSPLPGTCAKCGGRYHHTGEHDHAVASLRRVFLGEKQCSFVSGRTQCAALVRRESGMCEFHERHIEPGLWFRRLSQPDARQNSSRPVVGSADSPKGNPGVAAPSGSVNSSSAQPTTGAGSDDLSAQPQPESDLAWLKRTVEELTTARPVTVWAGDATGLLYASALSQLAVSFSSGERNAAMVACALENADWPLRRNARPAPEPPQPDARLEALEDSVDRLFLDGRVTRRWVEENFLPMSRPQLAENLERIEAEERAKCRRLDGHAGEHSQKTITKQITRG